MDHNLNVKALCPYPLTKSGTASNAKAQSCKERKARGEEINMTFASFAPLRLCAFALETGYSPIPTKPSVSLQMQPPLGLERPADRFPVQACLLRHIA